MNNHFAVLIIWKIKREFVTQFREYWQESHHANKSFLVKEILYRLPDYNAGFPVDKLADIHPDFVVFVNYAEWRGSPDFMKEVGDKIKKSAKKEYFEYDHRTRIPLEPTEVRFGIWPLSLEATCD